MNCYIIIQQGTLQLVNMRLFNTDCCEESIPSLNQLNLRA